MRPIVLTTVCVSLVVLTGCRRAQSITPTPVVVAEVRPTATELELDKLQSERRMLEAAQKALQEEREEKRRADEIAEAKRQAENKRRDAEIDRKLAEERAKREQDIAKQKAATDKLREQVAQEKVDALSKTAFEAINQYYASIPPGSKSYSTKQAITLLRVLHTTYVSGELNAKTMKELMQTYRVDAWYQAGELMKVGAGNYIPPGTKNNVTIGQAWKAAGDLVD